MSWFRTRDVVLSSTLIALGCASEDVTPLRAEPASPPEEQAQHDDGPCLEAEDGCSDTLEEPLPTNDDPRRQIRFVTPAEADERRARLVAFIWPDGLPKELPAVIAGVAPPAALAAIPDSAVARIDRLEVDVSQTSYRVRAFLIHPKNAERADRFVIVHQGHANDFRGGLGEVAAHLVSEGFTVAMMMMPLYGWNVLGGVSTTTRGTPAFKRHREMFEVAESSGDGRALRFFLEPIVQVLNHAFAGPHAAREASVIGLSGGGWSASLVAAIDPRVRFSVPVAGSLPLYLRNRDPKSVGDIEQYFPPLFDEAIAADGSGGGIATWLEIYALGAYGPGRRQIQITNEHDPCCFGGRGPETYAEVVADEVSELGQGRWEHVLDSTHAVHQVSDFAIEAVIDPLLGIDGG